MEWVASTLHTTSEHGVSSITTADAHTSAASSRLNRRPRRFKRTRPFHWKTKSGFCGCAITFQTCSTTELKVTCWKLADFFSSSSVKESLYSIHCIIAFYDLQPMPVLPGAAAYHGLYQQRLFMYVCHPRYWQPRLGCLPCRVLHVTQARGACRQTVNTVVHENRLLPQCRWVLGSRLLRSMSGKSLPLHAA